MNEAWTTDNPGGSMVIKTTKARQGVPAFRTPPDPPQYTDRAYWRTFDGTVVAEYEATDGVVNIDWPYGYPGDFEGELVVVGRLKSGKVIEEVRIRIGEKPDGGR